MFINDSVLLLFIIGGMGNRMRILKAFHKKDKASPNTIDGSSSHPNLVEALVNGLAFVDPEHCSYLYARERMKALGEELADHLIAELREELKDINPDLA